MVVLLSRGVQILEEILERVWDTDSPTLSTSAASLMSQLWLPELAASWIGTDKRAVYQKQGLLRHGWGGELGSGEQKKTSCSCQVYLRAVTRECRAAGTFEGQRDHLLAVRIWGHTGAGWSASRSCRLRLLYVLGAVHGTDPTA